MLRLVLLNVLIIGHRASSYNVEGNCEHPRTQENFDFIKYYGIWYGVAQFPPDSLHVSCYKVSFLDYENGPIFFANTNHAGPQLSYGKTILAATQITNESHKGKLVIDSGIISVVYWVLSTDYKSYSIIYVCLGGNSETGLPGLFIFTRSPQPGPDVIERYNTALDNIGLQKINSTMMQTINTDGCEEEPLHIIEDI